MAYFQVRAKSPFAIVTSVHTARNWYLRRLAESRKQNYDLPAGVYNAFWTETGSAIRFHFFKQYEEYFSRLVQEVQSIQSKLIVLYIPSGLSWENNLSIGQCRPFFRDLALSHGAEFCDLTNEFLALPIEAVTLLPENGHMSRFGNMLLAEKLGKALQKYDGYTADFHFDKRPELYGDLEANHDQVWDYNPSMLYRVQVNSYGLRGKLEVLFPKEKQRILCLGDSQTFGPYLDNKFIYTELLNRKFEGKEFFNAGKSGYGIVEELSLLEERAKYIEPDITVLQVLDNDIYGLFYFKRTDFNRKSEIYKPTKLELDFLEAVRQQADKP